MILIPRFLITIVTFPGFILQTVARRFWCDLLKIQVYEAYYFKGTIIHEKVETPLRAALIAFAPFSVNSVLCAILFFPVAFSWFFLDSEMTGLGNAAKVLLGWSGIAIGMHAIPSRKIVREYLEEIPVTSRRGIGYLIFRGIGAFFMLVGLLKVLWIDLIYAILIGIVSPYLLIKAFMII